MSALGDVSTGGLPVFRAILIIFIVGLSAVLTGFQTPIVAGTPPCLGWNCPCPTSGASPPCQITNNTTIHVTPSIAQDSSGKIFLFWDQNPGVYYLITNASNMAANIWPNAVSYPYHGQDYNPSPVALKNGTLLLFLSRQTTSGWSILYSRYNNGLGWSSETTMTASPPGDQSPAQSAIQDSSGKIWTTWTRNDNGDLRLKFADTNSNGSWDLGEP